jgi:multiple sugar transport system permease protein
VQVLIPLVRPGIVVAGIFAAIFIWNEFLVGMYVIDSESLKTVPIAAAGLISAQRPIDWNVAATVGVVTLIPLLIGSMAIQKHIVQGITAGSVK